MDTISVLYALCRGQHHATDADDLDRFWSVIAPNAELALTLAAGIRNAPVPFFIRPVTSGIANKISKSFLEPNFKTHYTFLEQQLKTAPDNGHYLCGEALTAADILMSFPLEAGQSRSGMTKETNPLVWAYVDRLHEHESYTRSVKKIEEIEGSFKSNL